MNLANPTSATGTDALGELAAASVLEAPCLGPQNIDQRKVQSLGGSIVYIVEQHR